MKTLEGKLGDMHSAAVALPYCAALPIPARISPLVRKRMGRKLLANTL